MIIFFSLIILFSIFIFFNLDKLDISQKPIKSDLLLCLGGGTNERINKTIRLYEENFIENKIIISDTINKYVDKKADKLEKIIINKDFIIKKYQTKNTLEELLFSQNIMEKYNYKSIIIVSDEPHTRRIKLLIDNFTKFNELNIKYTIVGSEVDWWNKEKFYSNKKAVYFAIQESFKIVHNFTLYSLLKYNIITQENLDYLNNYKKLIIKTINSMIKNVYDLLN